EYLLQAEDDPSLLVPARTVWNERGSDLKIPQQKIRASSRAAACRTRSRGARFPANRIQPEGGAPRALQPDIRSSVHIHQGSLSAPDIERVRSAAAGNRQEADYKAAAFSQAPGQKPGQRQEHAVSRSPDRF